MGWGGDMFPGSVWVYIQTYTNTHSDKPTRKTGQSICIKKDKKTCTEKDKLTHV